MITSGTSPLGGVQLPAVGLGLWKVPKPTAASLVQQAIRTGYLHLDLYLVHFPIAQRFVPFETRYPPGWVFDPDAPAPRMEFATVAFAETWAAMEALVDAGLVRHVGVCNVGTAMLRDLLCYARIR